MRPSLLEELARRWVPGTGPVRIDPWSDGLINQSCRVERDGRLYSLRVTAADDRDLGLDRQWECRVLARAAAAGLAPAIHCCRPADGILVADWAANAGWSTEDVRASGNIEAMAQLLRRVHELPIPLPARIMTPENWIAHYSAALQRRGRAVRRRWVTGLRAAAESRVAQLAAASGKPRAVLCHSDLHCLNIARERGLVLLDWEYAHVSDPYWDLAGWMANNDATADFAAEFLARYWERPATADELDRGRLFAWVYDFVCLLWSELYLSLRPESGAAAVAERAAAVAERLRRL
jgi:thiamine kinase-like enzyme